jgi:hypothetical protein
MARAKILQLQVDLPERQIGRVLCNRPAVCYLVQIRAYRLPSWRLEEHFDVVSPFVRTRPRHPG